MSSKKEIFYCGFNLSQHEKNLASILFGNFNHFAPIAPSLIRAKFHPNKVCIKEDLKFSHLGHNACERNFQHVEGIVVYYL